ICCGSPRRTGMATAVSASGSGQFCSSTRGRSACTFMGRANIWSSRMTRLSGSPRRAATTTPTHSPGSVLASRRERLSLRCAHTGTVGKVAGVSLDAPAFVCSPQTTFWRTVDEEQLDRKFLYAFMRSPLFVDQWAARKGETDMADYVSLTAQRELWVTVPPIN